MMKIRVVRFERCEFDLVEKVYPSKDVAEFLF